MNPIIIKGVISPSLCKFILSEISITRNCLKIVSPSMHSEVSNPAMYYSLINAENLLKFLTNKVSTIVGKDLAPTFSWTEYVRQGGKINSYTGRNSSEYAVVCCLEENNWPFYLDQEEIMLSVGDICIFLGSKTEYSRKEFTGNENTQVILNYVEASGQHSHLKYDTRKELGASIASAAPIVQAEQAGLRFKFY